MDGKKPKRPSVELWQCDNCGARWIEMGCEKSCPTCGGGIDDVYASLVMTMRDLAVYDEEEVLS